MKAKYCTFRITEEQLHYLESISKEKGFSNISEGIRAILFANIDLSKNINAENDFRYEKLERRSFATTHELWEKLCKITQDNQTISSFIRSAIQEKIAREIVK